MDTNLIQVAATLALLVVCVRIWMVGSKLLFIRQRADRARTVLPLTTPVAIKPRQTAQITARASKAFDPTRLFISSAGTEGGAADWVINDIKVGNKPQFTQSGDVPGDMFSSVAIDSFVDFDTAFPWQDVTLVVTYIGLKEEGVPFFASLVGADAGVAKLRNATLRAKSKRAQREIKEAERAYAAERN